MAEQQWAIDFRCGCRYRHASGDTYCADHTHHDGTPTADNPPAEYRHRNDIDDVAYDHEAEHRAGPVDRRICQGLGCPYGDH